MIPSLVREARAEIHRSESSRASYSHPPARRSQESSSNLADFAKELNRPMKDAILSSFSSFATPSLFKW